MGTLELYIIKDEGYHAFLIRKGWQVAKLNSSKSLKVENIKQLDMHNYTDEVFLLTKGKTVLITAKFNNNKTKFKLDFMKPGVIYNVPVKTWHNIAMNDDCEVVIVENDNTHISDFEFIDLSDEMRIELILRVNKLYKIPA